jgi:hypothetical protein
MVTARRSENDPASQGRGIGRMLAGLPGEKVVVVDTPYSHWDVPSCLEQHRRSASACAIPAAYVLGGGIVTRERAAAKAAGGTMIDLTHAICPSYPCSVVPGGIVMLRDTHHLTATYSRTLGVPLGAAIRRKLGL